ncbi:MAG: hypothetical protein JKY37_29365, partial [Nannocystaceae bacterium]|nr:hypothetical protein [Nannocystaceae bacterium]
MTGTIVALALSLLAAAPPVRESTPVVEVVAPPQRDASRPTTRVGVLPLVIAADAAPEVGDARQRLSAEVRDTLAETSYEVVSLSTEQTGDAESPYCKDAVCWQQLATQHDVTHFLVLIVHFTDPDYRIEAKLVDGRSGSDAGALETTCDLCGISELEARVRDVAATMRREIEATMLLPPTLVVT